MKTLLFFSLSLALFSCSSVSAATVFNLNVFDQLQGDWQPGFRENRMAAVSDYVRSTAPDIVVFQEAQGNRPGSVGGGDDSIDGALLASAYPHRKYVHEMTGKDGASYVYWIDSKKEPRKWIEDGFSFPGGVDRRVLAGIWDGVDGAGCLGVIGLHLSYQTSAVRQLEAQWIVDWVKSHEMECSRWLVVGDFNANETSAEMNVLFNAGLNHLFRELKPTVGAFNPIRRIYGENIPSLTIDWALGWNLKGEAEVVLDRPYLGRWVSDHAGINIRVLP